ncbi:hypothetical protein OA84_02300 [Kaistella solincola]|uniref:30S ribosomal protein S21 n=1 Tax=Kaistella solincola TaxID=510955 RepID=A0ABR4ZTX3_9FLAO|nr:hypothetical protein OA84_02300 [Kaistella solincola]
MTNSFFQGRLGKFSARNNFKKNDKIAANFLVRMQGFLKKREKEKGKRKKYLKRKEKFLAHKQSYAPQINL